MTLSSLGEKQLESEPQLSRPILEMLMVSIDISEVLFE
jgi:hypothetical protein